MKTKKGVTLLMLALIVLIMTILLTVTVTNGTEAYNDAKKTKLQAEISQIEILVDNYIKRNSGITFDSYELDTSTYTADQISQFPGEYIIDGKITLYIVDLNKIDAEEVAYGVQDKGVTDRYLYSPVTKRVYHEQGRKIGGAIYHRVDDNKVARWVLKRTTNESGIVTKVVVTNGVQEIDVGTTINYMPEGVGDTNYTGGWKVLGTDATGRLLIMSADSITGSDIKLGGISFTTAQTSYINAITTLNDTVSSYKDGIIGIDVRSITVDDINNIIGYDKTRSGSGITKYGVRTTFEWSSTGVGYSYIENGKEKTGILGNAHNNGFTYYDEINDKFVTLAKATSGNIGTFENTCYYYVGNTLLDDTTEAYKMVFGETTNASYWLASRYVNFSTSHVSYGMNVIKSGGQLGYMYLLISAGDNYSFTPNSVRAVVTLANNVGVELNESTGVVDILE